MNAQQLVRRGLAYYWRTHLAVVLGVATAVAVLAGALLVGDSVRGSLRDLVLQRLGRTGWVVTSSGFFREALAADFHADPDFASSFEALCPLIVVQGLVTEQTSGRRASRVQVYGIDERFWQFHEVNRQAPAGSEAAISASLAAEIGATPGSTLLVRVQRPSAVPIESLHGDKERLGRTLRLTVGEVATAANLGEFSLRPQQGEVRTVFLPLQLLQRELDLDGRVNAILVGEVQGGSGGFREVQGGSGRFGEVQGGSGSGGFGEVQGGSKRLEALVRRRTQLEDLGLTLRTLEARQVILLESGGGLLDAARASAADRAVQDTGMMVQPVLTYLANSLRSGDREIPYSLVTATDLRTIAPDANITPDSSRPAPIVLNEWAARDLNVKAGDPLTVEYYVWEDPGRLLTRTADFRVAAVVPIAGAAGDRDLAPVYPGITESANLGDWDPPFPLDLRRVRRVDEDYWESYRTTPKAFIPLEVGQALWRSKYGDQTSVRIAPEPGQSLTAARDRYAERLRAEIDPLAVGVSVQDVRTQGLTASRGATDFGAYFTYFSFFLVTSALLLAGLFFRLSVEQRAREVGLLRSVGFTTAGVRRLFAAEGAILAAIGSVLGVIGAVGYGYLMMVGLGTWWVDAVGTTALRLHVSPVALAAGAVGTFLAAMACIWWTLGGLARLSERSLLAGSLAADVPASPRSRGKSSLIGAIGFGVLGAGLMAATIMDALDRTGAFFGAGTSLLVACLCLLAFRLRRPPVVLLHGHGWWPVARLGWRNVAERPGRSLLSIAVIASATFILISVDAFRREAPVATDRGSGVGGYPLLVELTLPTAHDPNSREGREALGLSGLADVGKALTFEPFRVLPGDDASCLNLYEPTNPRILGVTSTFVAAGRFAFQGSLASTDTERTNPWLLLNRDLGPERVPVIADANSMTYVLHRKLGEEIVIDRGGRPIRLHLVAALADSIFQGELLMSDANFLKLFPAQPGYQFLLVDVSGASGTAPEQLAQLAATIEEAESDLGADAVLTSARLAEFHKVENTYLATFRTLGGLGLLVGTVGLAAVLLRNVLERRREMALLGAVGYRGSHIFAIVAAETALLLGWGLLIGTLCALVAIGPAMADRGGGLPVGVGGLLLLLGVVAAGLLSSFVATRAALHTPLIEALRSE